jgi:hypothetical protein
MVFSQLVLHVLDLGLELQNGARQDFHLTLNKGRFHRFWDDICGVEMVEAIELNVGHRGGCKQSGFGAQITHREP